MRHFVCSFSLIFFSAFSLFLFQSTAASAQVSYKERPINERDVSFLYAEFGLPNSNNLKVVVFTSYIYRYKYSYGYNHPVLGSESMRNRLLNSFALKVKEIVENEHNVRAHRTNQVIYKPHAKIEWAFSDGVIAEATGPKLYLTLNSSTALLEKVREEIIQQYRDKGYKVYQVTFDEYYDAGILGMKLEHISKLSPLYVTPYSTGTIRSMAKPYQEESSSASKTSSGIVVEESRTKSNNTKSNSSYSQTKTRDDSYWKAQVEMNRMNAGRFEMEGERLYKLGTMFYMQALKNYEAAYQLYPTSRVKARIDEINAYVAFGKAVNEGVDNLENIFEELRQTLDAAGIPRFRAGQFSYSGDFKNFVDKSTITPFSTSLTYGFYRLLAFEAGLLYAQSPVYNLYLTDKNGNRVYEYDADRKKSYKTIQAHQTTVGITLSAGVAIPIKSFLVYGLYGGYIPYFNIAAESSTPGFDYPDVRDDLGIFYWQDKVKFGVNVKIPKSRIALGAHYNMNWIKGEVVQDKDSSFNDVSNGSKQYYVGGSADETYKFNQFGVSLFILSKD